MQIAQTRNFSEEAWKNNPKLSPNSWRMVEGLTLSKFAVDIRLNQGKVSEGYALERSSESLNAVYTNLHQDNIPENMMSLVEVQSHELDDAIDKADVVLLEPAMTEVSLTDLEKLETAVKEGKIVTYGIASYRFTLPKEQEHFLDVNKMVVLAEEAASKVYGRKKRSQLKVIAAPCSIFNLSALTEINHVAKTFHDDEAVPLLEMLSRRHLSFIALHPLLMPCAKGILELPIKPAETFTEMLSLLGKEEVKMLRLIPTDIQKAFPALSMLLPELLEKVDYWQFQNTWAEVRIAFGHLLPHIEEHIEAFKSYTEVAQKTYRAAEYEFVQKELSSLPLEHLIDALPEELKEKPLDELMLSLITSLPGVTLAAVRVDDTKRQKQLTNLMEQADVADIGSILA